MEPSSQTPPPNTGTGASDSQVPPPDPAASQPLPRTETYAIQGRPTYKKPFYILLIIVLLATAAGTAYWLLNRSPKNSSTVKTPAVQQKSSVQTPQGLQLDEKKNYGDKYANGILPVGDSKYVTDAAKSGYVFACSNYAANLKNSQGGAGSRGPWFINNNTEYDLNKKLHVQGEVSWQSSFSNKVSGNSRAINTNDLPSHTTGTFPISSADPAYTYDRNPSSIKAQSLAYSLNSSPAYGNPTCMGGEAGIMLTGAALFNAFDAGGRDAGAWEIQDSCGGHPQKDGEYHYHTLSSCIKDTSVHTVIGFALDGFPITGPQVAAGNILTTADLDECHGLTSPVVLDGKTITTYHYVMTQDFPYSVSCFRSAAIQPPGQQGQAAQPVPQT